MFSNCSILQIHIFCHHDLIIRSFLQLRFFRLKQIVPDGVKCLGIFLYSVYDIKVWRGETIGICDNFFQRRTTTGIFQNGSALRPEYFRMDLPETRSRQTKATSPSFIFGKPQKKCPVAALESKRSARKERVLSRP